MALVRILKKHGLKLFAPVLGLGLLYWLWVLPPKYQGYAPDQPIPFSHKIHAGELKMECQFCHSTVERSRHASVPDVATCMKCHQEVASDSEDIQFLRSAYKQGIPIRWNRVHDLPDHARFSHKPHIAQGLACADCHGAVEKMDKVEVYSAFNMGWCVNCHRQHIEKVKAEKGDEEISLHLTECSTCHY